MPDHYCERAILQTADGIIYCDRPARFQSSNGYWLCAEHWDEDEKQLAIDHEFGFRS
jgi:hypothetical protein